MSVLAVRHCGIAVSDLKRSLHFYRDLLGLKVIKRTVEERDYIDKVTGLHNVKVTTVKIKANHGSLIELLYFLSHPCAPGTKKSFYKVGLTHIALTVNDVDEEYCRLTKVGVRFISPPQVSPDKYAKVAFCRDYDGVLIELVQVL